MKALKFTFVLALFLTSAVFAANSSAIKFERSRVQGEGPLPYNYRIIDGHIHAGGHPLNPINKFGNSDEQVLSILHYLKSQGVMTVIDLENTLSIKTRYEKLLDDSGIKLLHVPMSYIRVPNTAEWAKIRTAMTKPVYIHCKWGADRTGSVIAKYLIEEKGYTIDEALKAVSNGGSHSGMMGGIKRIYILDPAYRRFWERKN